MDTEVKNQKIGIYSPYLHIMGGGERYLLTIASNLAKKNKVVIFADKSTLKQAKTFFDISLANVKFANNNLFQTKKLARKKLTDYGFNIFFYMTDGSLFFPIAKKNYLIIQSPAHIPRLNLINKLKLGKWTALCYSSFMKQIIRKRLKRQALILSPCIDTDKLMKKQVKKENIILSVGRFFSHLHNKNHFFLVRTFKKHYKKILKNWKLVIIGGANDEKSKDIVTRLVKESSNFPIEIYQNISFKDLLQYFKKAKIYWHAAGYGQDLKNHPEKAEHFGITTLEAMAASAVPVVFNAGGQKDIVKNTKCGFLWNDEKQFIKKTSKLTKDKKTWEKFSQQAASRALDFSNKKFHENLQKILTDK